MKTIKRIMIGMTVAIWVLFALVAAVKADCIEGTVVVNSVESYAVVDEYDCIDGTLVISGNFHVTNLIFHHLEIVTGSIIMIGRHPAANWQLAFLLLKEVGGMVQIGSNQHLTNIQFGAKIVEIYGDFIFYNNNHIAMLRLGHLQFVGNDFRVYENNSLTSIVGNYMEGVTGLLEITDNPSYYQYTAEAWGYAIPAGEYLIEDNKE
jgi:hypothetical protein